jgi:protein-S-isoprenylcysteine O-methyltransferase Ste14
MVRYAYGHTFLAAGGVVCLLCAGAGTMRWWWAWSFAGLIGVAGLRIVRWLGSNNPALLQERMRGIGHAAQPTWDKWWVVCVYLLAALWLVLIGATAVRWAGVPVSLMWRAGGGVLMLAGVVLLDVTVRANAYLSPAVRVQHERGHAVVRHGPYGVVRHPMYAALLPLGVGAALWLGSWPGVAGAVVLWGAVLWRAVGEERVLLAELVGYREYAARVRARVVPGVW